jgi:hypothetical protein
MIHQLNDLKRAIRPRDPGISGQLHGLGSTSGSLSPFHSYLSGGGGTGAGTGAGVLHSSGLHSPLGAGMGAGAGTLGGAGAGAAHSAASGAGGVLQWMHAPDWQAYIVFIDKWCEEIFYILGRGATLVTVDDEVVEEEDSPAARKRKKRYVYCFCVYLCVFFPVILLFSMLTFFLLFFSLNQKQCWTESSDRVGAVAG